MPPTTRHTQDADVAEAGHWPGVTDLVAGGHGRRGGGGEEAGGGGIGGLDTNVAVVGKISVVVDGTEAGPGRRGPPRPLVGAMSL